MISIDTTITFCIGSVFGYLCRLILEHFLIKSRTSEERQIREFNEAAHKFRSILFAELEGLYPVTQHWDNKIFYRFSKSIIKIESAAVELKNYIKNKSDFDIAVKKYCKFCREITWDRTAAWSLYPSMRKEGEIDPREEFAICVEALLNYAKRSL